MSDNFQGKLWGKVVVPNCAEWRELTSAAKDLAVKGWIAEEMLRGVLEALDRTPIVVEFSEECGLDGLPKHYTYEAELFVMSEPGLNDLTSAVEKHVKAEQFMHNVLVKHNGKVPN